MHFSTRTADAVHILVLIALSEGSISSREIAKSTASSPSHIRSLMSLLSRAGIILSSQGKAAPALARKAEDITLLQIYQAMEGGTPLLHLDTHVNEECAAGMYIQQALQGCYDEIQNRFEAELAGITLADLIKRYAARLSSNPLGFDLTDYAWKPDEFLKKNELSLPTEK